MFEVLFKFPIVMVDGNKEEEKERANQRLALDNASAEVDIIIGEAECPFDDFIAVSDRWLPTEESFQRALQGEFDACSVLFGQSGTYVVPWSKEKFKKEMTKFSVKFHKDVESGAIKVLNMSNEQFLDSMKDDKE